MTNARILKKKAREFVDEAGEYLADGAEEFIGEGAARVEEGLDEAIDEADAKLHGRRWMPWLGLAAGIAVVAGAIYLSRHRAQRLLVEKGVRKGLKKGLEGGAQLALHLPGGLRKARDSADAAIRESARLWDRIPVRVVMK